MKIFISWSGERSKQVAELLKEWLKCVLQALNPWVSTLDIDGGSIWFQQITEALNDTHNGIVCLTAENKNNPWILFEAGALAKGLSTSRVCTFLIDVEPKDIEDPLAQFNHTLPTKESMFKLVSMLDNKLGERALGEKVLNKVFSTYWEQFEMDFEKILKNTKDEKTITENRNDTDILSEVLYVVRSLNKRISNIEQEKELRREFPDQNSKIIDDQELYMPDTLKNECLNMLEQGVGKNAIYRFIAKKYDFPISVARELLERVICDRRIERIELI